MTDLDRRTVVLGAAWMVPVIAMAIATPLAAASGYTDRLTFNTGRAWDENPWDPTLNANKPKIGFVFAAMDTTGPNENPVGAVTFTIVLTDSAGVSQTQTHVATIDRGWGATPDKTIYFENVAKGRYDIFVKASAAGVNEISRIFTEGTISR